MIPYFQIDAIQAGPLTVQMWGLWVASGISIGSYLSYRLARQYFLSGALMLDIAIWGLIGGLIGARFGHVLFYGQGYYWAHPEEIVRFWHGGASSVGGFIGAAAGVAIFGRVRMISWREMVAYLDIGTVNFWLAWAIGRIGCFFIHDHPGVLSGGFLAVNFTSGPRLDLGLIESLCALGLFVIFRVLFRHFIVKRWGLIFSYSLLVYSFIRFGLDFWRARDLPYSDPRYWQLTPAQWAMMALALGLTLYLFWGKITKRKNGEIA